MTLKQIVMLIFVVAAFSFYPVSNVYAAFPEPYTETKDITDSDKSFNIKDNVVTVSYSRPARPMQPFNIMFKFEKDNIKSLSYTTNMIMNMGRYIFNPEEISDNIYTVTPTLPKCGSGRTLWYGLINLTYDNGVEDKLIFFYNVK